MSGNNASRKAKREALTPSYCEIPGCDWPYKIQRHRILPGRDGGKYKLGNVIGLCPGHHWCADEGLIPAEYLKDIVDRRIQLSGKFQDITDESSSAGASGPQELGRHSPEEPAAGTGSRPADAAAASSAGSLS